ncbi:MAG: thioredoxin family protein [Roseiflexaceae bacterium]|nr:thioredoxin family protein [Roseiflexaceae bacterium]
MKSILRLYVGLLVLAALAACTQTPQPNAGNSDVTPVFAFSEAVVGPNRLAIGLLQNGSPINNPEANVKVKIFDLSTNNPKPLADAKAIYYGRGLPAGIWVVYMSFDQPGNVGVEVQAQLPGQPQPSVRRYNLEVVSTSAAPRVGQPAISAKTLTVRDVPELKQLTSGADPDPALYQISLDDALKGGKPTAVLFATPNFCRTATCGPSVTVLSQLQKKYGDRMQFIHTEVYRFPFGDSAKLQAESMAKAQSENRAPMPAELRAGLSDAMATWNLPSEPWLFLIDAKGIVVARYEGGITSEELSPAIENLLAGKPIQ